ncbi:phage/plasmid primase, P4 family [Ruminococcus sp.]|uniref:phage/plasmid primase, P4 family n=1 Tax=Ruminococcus sp. TaxID=41978 RepID=UPI00386B8F99
MIQTLTTANDYTGTVIYSADSVRYKTKPSGGTTAGIRERLEGSNAHTCSTLQELAQRISQGITIQGAQLRDKLNPEDTSTDARFLSQQLFMIDIDNDEKRDGKKEKYKRADSIDTPEQIMDIARGAGLTPCIIAHSFSSGRIDPDGQAIPKYHVFFAVDKPITSNSEARRVILNLQHTFGAVDITTKDPARIYYGAPEGLPVIVIPAVNSSESLLNCYQEPENVSSPAPAAPTEDSGSLSWDAVLDDKSDPFADRERSRRGRGEEADPDVLLSMCDPNSDYSEWVKVSSSYKSAGGSLDVWLQWCSMYTGSKKSAQEQERENRTTWKGLKCSRNMTVATLKRFAKQSVPEEYASYMKALQPAKTSRKKDKPARAQSGEPVERWIGLDEDSEEKEGVQWLEYPKGKVKPQNWVDFAYETNKGVQVDAYLLADNIRKTSHYIFVKGADPNESVRRYWYSDGVYMPVNDEFIKSRIRMRLEIFGAYLCKKRYIEEAFYHLTIDPVFHSDGELNADENIINFRNGLLHIDTDEITEHTPAYLSTVQIPCDYKPGLDLRDCPTFTRFITNLGNSDLDSINTLIEYIGAVISNVSGARFKKALFLRGAGNCGKSQYIELMRRLLGERHFSSTSLDKLEARFGAYSLYNKRLAGDPDCKFLKLGDLNIFKQITGGDPLFLEAKCKNGFSYKYTGFLLFGCNELPYFGGDNGSWVYSRMLLINCGKPVTEQERDPLLIDKMYAEREAIVAVAVRMFKATIARRYRFIESASSRQLLEEYRGENDPVRNFLSDCCKLRQQGEPLNDGITQHRFYEVYCNWYASNGNRSAPSSQQFRRALAHAADVYDIKSIERGSNGQRFYCYTLTDEARRLYGAGDTLNYSGI